MEMDFKRREKIVGAFMLGVAVLLLSTVVVIGRGKDWFKTYVTFYTTFNEGYNLQENAAVKLFKAEIGKVRKITLEQNKVRLTLAILEDYAPRIRTDSEATVESPTLIGSEYVSIRPGSVHAPAIPRGGEIPSRAKKSLDQYWDELEVEKTAQKFVHAVQDLADITRGLRDPQGPLFAALHAINQILGHVEVVVRQVREGRGSLGGVAMSNDLLEQLQRNMQHFELILSHLEQAAVQTPETMQLVHENLAQLRQMGTQVQGSLVTLQTILNHLEQGSRDVPLITQTSREGIQEIREGVDNIDKVVKSLQNNSLIRHNLPAEPELRSIDAGLRR